MFKQLDVYHTKMLKEQEARELEGKQRLLELQEAMAQQAQQDKERYARRWCLCRRFHQILSTKGRVTLQR